MPDIKKELVQELIDREPDFSFELAYDFIASMFRIDRNGILKRLGYIGIYDDKGDTQIENQLTIFDKKDVAIIGYEDYVDEEHSYLNMFKRKTNDQN
jgi:hypothetical protein